jgi:hypothetical protein
MTATRRSAWAPRLAVPMRWLWQAGEDPAGVVAAARVRLGTYDQTGTEPRLDRIAFLRKTRQLDLVEILQVRPFDREDELLQLPPPRGSTSRAPGHSASSEHLLPPASVAASGHVVTAIAFVSIW